MEDARMKNAFLAMFVLAMAAVSCGSSNSNDKPDTGTTGAGGGQPTGDAISQVCNKAESCQTLSTLRPELTSAAQCIQTANSLIAAYPDMRSTVDLALNSCLASTDCAAFTACAKKLLDLMPKQP
jgi:hypothetical protein